MLFMLLQFKRLLSNKTLLLLLNSSLDWNLSSNFVGVVDFFDKMHFIHFFFFFGISNQFNADLSIEFVLT